MQTHPARIPFAALFLALILACLGGGCTPSGPKALLQGAELLRKGKYSAAIAKLNIAKDLLPGDARAWNYLGLAYHGAGHYGEAIIAYQRAQQLDQNLAEARFNLGQLYLEQGNPVSAADEFAVFTALEPKSVQGWVRLGDAHLQNQRLDRAQTSYYTALNLRKETPEAFNGLGLILLQRKNPRDAYRYFVEAIKYDAGYAPALLNMAVVAQTQLNSLPTALTKYREYLAKSPDASNANAVQAAIRQLDAELNPRPLPREAKPPVAKDIPAAAASPSAAPVTVARTDVPAASSNAAQVAHPVAVKTNLPVTTPPTNTLASTKPEPGASRSGPATNPPPTQLAKADSPKIAIIPGKPAIEAPEPKASLPPVANVASQPAPASTTGGVALPAKTTEEPPLEVVTLEDPAGQAVGAIKTAGEIQSAATTQAASSRPATTPNSSQAAPVQDQGKPPAEEKRGFFQRINPANLFRSDNASPPAKRSSEIVTPLPPDTSRSTASPAASAEVIPQPATVAKATQPDVTPLPKASANRGYQYGKIKKPTAGDRPTAERLFERGIGAQSRRDPGGAASFFGASASADPTYFPAHYNLGLVGYSSGQWYQALSAFETALVLDPNSAPARYNFALTLQKANFAADAARELEKLLGQHPEDTRAMLLLGNVYAQDLEEVAAARRQYQQILAREPQHPQATAIRYWLVEHP